VRGGRGKVEQTSCGATKGGKGGPAPDQNNTGGEWAKPKGGKEGQEKPNTSKKNILKRRGGRPTAFAQKSKKKRGHMWKHLPGEKGGGTSSKKGGRGGNGYMGKGEKGGKIPKRSMRGDQ